jgi:hypothetical protein
MKKLEGAEIGATVLEQLQPRWPLQLCLLPPVFLDYYLNDSGGYDVPRHPYANSTSENAWCRGAKN